MKYSKILRAALVAGAVLSLTACGHIQKEISSEADMLDKAEFATGIDARNLRIVEDSVSGSIDSVNYKVKAKNGQPNPPGTLASVRRGGMAEKTAKCEAYVKRGSLI